MTFVFDGLFLYDLVCFGLGLEWFILVWFGLVCFGLKCFGLVLFEMFWFGSV